ncbi:hypothetical protein GHK86_04350 [Acidimicrobiaceae bacterium USS-CC1]|uniref:Uncharacterized protein n=1 Tax=Acidiferrimicrobium australe TaxID=2664430 RepID=A0ABW9QQP2_9ACTN|nr:hypothetical protein [Acidiferrimicrobium australe]
MAVVAFGVAGVAGSPFIGHQRSATSITMGVATSVEVISLALYLFGSQQPRPATTTR